MALHKEDKRPLQTREDANGRSNDTCASVNAGICGFACCIRAWKINPKTVGLEISESGCLQIQQLSGLLDRLTIDEVFMPLTRNPVYIAAEQSGSHPSCPVPAAVLKAAEAALELALPGDAVIRFRPCNGEQTNKLDKFTME